MHLEKMAEFFDARVELYDTHMLADIEGADKFYPETANVLPDNIKTLLDLGVGTGLELEYIFRHNPSLSVTAVDISEGMLDALKRKFADKAANGQLTVLKNSYFDIDFGTDCYDAAVSVESLHHFSPKQKLILYTKIYSALAPHGTFVITDYIALDNEYEQSRRAEYEKLLNGACVPDGEFHFDLPLTVEHESRLLEKAGFDVTVHAHFGATAILICNK